MEKIDGLIIIFFMLVIGVPYLLSGSNFNLLCKLGRHKTFVNTPFDYCGNVGMQTLRCSRCWKDIKQLGYPDE